MSSLIGHCSLLEPMEMLLDDSTNYHMMKIGLKMEQYR